MELKQIGRYDIKSLIGQGGMSAVYLGYDPRSLREVAIKILPPYYLHAPKFRERFEREALTIAILEHPAIVPVYDMGEDDGQPYIVMRYMSGGSLAGKLKRGPILLRECVEMYLRLAPALDTAHARGITHRDVKPDNLLFDKYDNVFLSDFGLARLRETIGFANISDGSILGTPAYMSPEQIQGASDIDGRSDIYSLGVVLYHMLCGSVPFTGTTAASVMMMHLVNPVPQILEQNNSLPIGIQAVLERAMAKNPKDRYQTVGEFVKSIQAVSSGVHKKPEVTGIVPAAPEPGVKQSTYVFPPRKSGILSRLYSEASEQLDDGQPPTTSGIPEAAVNSPPQAGKSSPDVETVSTQAARQSEQLGKRFLSVPVWGWLVAVLLLFSLALTVFQWSRGGFPFSLLAGASQAPESAPPAFILGQADKIAFLNASDIWVSDLNGSNLARLTSDGMRKSHLNWSPDGKTVLFTQGNCLNSVDMETRQTLNLGCFSGVTLINAFDISPDGQDTALVLGASDLYILPFSQIYHLRQTSVPADLASLAQCSSYSPYHLDASLKAIQWSEIGGQLALLVSSTVDGVTRDQVSILDFSQCSASPSLVREILPTHFLFTLRGYYQNPKISSLSWSDENQLILNGFMNERGFGSLQLYDLGGDQSREVDPNGSCCYRDASLSPDGTYLFYTYQPENGGEISLYYAPISADSQAGGEVTAIALPPGFNIGFNESIQPALRTAH
jgi:serine/threonine protein kinase